MVSAIGRCAGRPIHLISGGLICDVVTAEGAVPRFSPDPVVAAAGGEGAIGRIVERGPRSEVLDHLRRERTKSSLAKAL